MAENKTYAELLRDPRWQKKRLQIMKRDKFACKLCGDKETTLNVHHKTYEYGKAPWDYPNDNFMTLCEDCHEILTSYKKAGVQFLVTKILKIKNRVITETYFFTKHTNNSMGFLCKDSNERWYFAVFNEEIPQIIQFLKTFEKNG